MEKVTAEELTISVPTAQWSLLPEIMKIRDFRRNNDATDKIESVLSSYDNSELDEGYKGASSAVDLSENGKSHGITSEKPGVTTIADVNGKSEITADEITVPTAWRLFIPEIIEIGDNSRYRDMKHNLKVCTETRDKTGPDRVIHDVS